MFAVLWIVVWCVFQAKAEDSWFHELINDDSIQNKSLWREEKSEAVLNDLILSWVDVKPLVSYGSMSINDNSHTLQSKSNLVAYNDILLPQLAVINYDTELISMSWFLAKETSRDDIQKLIATLITSGVIYKNTYNLPDVDSMKWKWQTIEWWLLEWFNLGCLDKTKASDIVCNQFLDSFIAYWKYYALWNYTVDIETILRTLNNQKKKVEVQEICDMIIEYTWHSWDTSTSLWNIVNQYCSEGKEDYSKMKVFIDMEASLSQLSDTVYNDPDVNAYKLLSSMQKVYNNNLEWINLDIGFIKKYLNYIQALIDKDNGKNKYLWRIYKDIIYVFNEDILKPKLLDKWQWGEVSELYSSINQWNKVLGHSSLISQLTTENIVITATSSRTGIDEKKTLEELFSAFYTDDRLIIRKVTPVSNEELKVQTEISSPLIKETTNWETIKAVVSLRGKNNVLYVNNIRITWQPEFVEILNQYAATEDLSFKVLLSRIDEQISFRWISEQESEEKFELCDAIAQEGIDIYECDESSVSLYKWNIWYQFTLSDWRLESFTISDENLESTVKSEIEDVAITKSNTPSILLWIISFEVNWDNLEQNLENKMQAIDQFRIHFKIIPNIFDVEWEDKKFFITFSLWEFDFQAYYDIETHVISKISYVSSCEKVLEIRGLTIDVTTENESQLTEILNNPKGFFPKANAAAYKKYQQLCADEK